MKQNEKQMMQIEPVKLEPYGPYEETRTMSGLIIPGGTKLLSVAPVSGMTFGIYRRQLKAKVFTVQGTWTFVPNDETIKVIQNG